MRPRPYIRGVPTTGLAERLSATWRLLARELGAFGVVGSVCFVLDLGLFQLLYAHMGVGAVTARLLSTLVSMSAAFLAHRWWSFSHRAGSGWGREYVVFVGVNAVTLLLSLAVVAFVRYPLAQHDPLVLQLANVGSVALGTVIRFLAYRRWVFVAGPRPATVLAQAPSPNDLDRAA